MLALEGRDPRGLRGGKLRGKIMLTGIRFQVLEFQLHLVKQAAAAFRAGPILRPLEFGDLQLQVGDQCIRRDCLRSGVRKFCLGIRCPPGHGYHKRFERFDIVRERLSRSNHGRSESSSSLCSNRKTAIWPLKSGPIPHSRGAMNIADYATPTRRVGKPAGNLSVKQRRPWPRAR